MRFLRVAVGGDQIVVVIECLHDEIPRALDLIKRDGGWFDVPVARQ